MAQAIGIVRILIAGHDLIDALPQQRQRVMAYPFIVSRSLRSWTQSRVR